MLMKRTRRDLLVWPHALEELGGEIHHVRPLGELILGDLDILFGEEARFGKVVEDGEGEMPIQILNRRS